MNLFLILCYIVVGIPALLCLVQLLVELFEEVFYEWVEEDEKVDCEVPPHE